MVDFGFEISEISTAAVWTASGDSGAQKLPESLPKLCKITMFGRLLDH